MELQVLVEGLDLKAHRPHLYPGTQNAHCQHRLLGQSSYLRIYQALFIYFKIFPYSEEGSTRKKITSDDFSDKLVSIDFVVGGSS